jgi:hypothetical protein
MSMDEREKRKVSRREAIAIVGIGAAMAGTTEVLAQGTASALPSSAAAIQDPRSKYPIPPFKKQTQTWPGLAQEMDPKPDHGETSYRGSGRLSGRKALITGGDSGMGRAAAIAYAREGADVAINYFPSEEPDAREVMQLIKKAGRNGVPIPGDLRDEAFCQKLVSEALSAFREPG